MNAIPTVCPVCDHPLSVTRLHCRNCDTAIEGHFEMGRLGQLTSEQLEFVETFVRCEGKLNRMEGELGLSYPTLRSRLRDIISAMGFEPETRGAELDDEERNRILDELASGSISSEEAMRMLEGEVSR